jgi:hypothetical protein
MVISLATGADCVRTGEVRVLVVIEVRVGGFVNQETKKLYYHSVMNSKLGGENVDGCGSFSLTFPQRSPQFSDTGFQVEEYEPS